MGTIILVMAEYSADDPPLWYRGSRDLVGLADAGTLGLSTPLRDDLRTWNDVFDELGEPDFAWPSKGVVQAHRRDAFSLASRVQLELGDDAHVWCGAGAGIDTVFEQGTAIVPTSRRTGTDLEFLRDGRRDVRSTRAAGGRPGTARALVHWRALTERTGTPFGNAGTRALRSSSTRRRSATSVGSGRSTGA